MSTEENDPTLHDRIKTHLANVEKQEADKQRLREQKRSENRLRIETFMQAEGFTGQYSVDMPSHTVTLRFDNKIVRITAGDGEPTLGMVKLATGSGEAIHFGDFKMGALNETGNTLEAILWGIFTGEEQF